MAFRPLRSPWASLAPRPAGMLGPLVTRRNVETRKYDEEKSYSHVYSADTSPFVRLTRTAFARSRKNETTRIKEFQQTTFDMFKVLREALTSEGAGDGVKSRPLEKLNHLLAVIQDNARYIDNTLDRLSKEDPLEWHHRDSGAWRKQSLEAWYAEERRACIEMLEDVARLDRLWTFYGQWRDHKMGKLEDQEVRSHIEAFVDWVDNIDPQKRVSVTLPGEETKEALKSFGPTMETGDDLRRPPAKVSSLPHVSSSGIASNGSTERPAVKSSDASIIRQPSLQEPKASARAQARTAKAVKEKGLAEAKAEEVQAEAKAEEMQAEAKAEEAQQAEPKAEEVQAEAKAEEMQAEAKAEEAQQAEPTAEEVQAESKAEEAQTEAKAEEVQAGTEAQQTQAGTEAQQAQAGTEAQQTPPQ